MKINNLSLKRDKGVAGLTILLSVVAMIFVIGFLIMIFAIVGSNLATSQYTDTSISFTNVTTSTGVNASGTFVTGYAPDSYRSCALTVNQAINRTDNLVINSGNYTISGCILNGSTASLGLMNNSWNITGSISYKADNTATGIINDTNNSLATVPTWFPIIITIAVMVSLILLTVIIIVAIRSTGLLEGGQ